MLEESSRNLERSIYSSLAAFTHLTPNRHYSAANIMVLAKMKYTLLFIAFLALYQVTSAVNIGIGDMSATPVLNHDANVCTSKEDCCRKAIAGLRHVIAASTGQSKSARSIYPLCRPGYTMSSTSGSECQRRRPFEESVSHTPYSSLTDCLANNKAISGSINTACMGPLMQAHEQCLQGVFDVCTKTGCTVSANFPFSDWSTSGQISTQYLGA